MTLSNRIIVGISGASCSGKTTLAKLLKATFPWASIVHQDAYYHPNDPKYHVYLPDVKHFNWDLKSAVNFPRMESDLQNILTRQQLQRLPPVPSEGSSGQSLLQFDEKLLFCPNDDFISKHRPSETETKYLLRRYSTVPLILLEGHILFSHPSLYKLFTHKYFLTLDQAELFSRRRKRVYEPPNPPGYMEKYVWPAYVSRLEEIRDLPNIYYYDAKQVPLLDMYHQIKQSITVAMAELVSPEPPFDEYSDRVKVNQKG